MTSKEWVLINFRLENSEQEDRTTFYAIPVSPGNFPLKRPGKSCSFTFQSDFLVNFLNGKESIFLSQLLFQVNQYRFLVTGCIHIYYVNAGKQVGVFYTFFAN